MKLWLTAFTVLFALAELYQWLTDAAWVQQFDLPLPMMMLAGAGLAIASNADKQIGLPWRSQAKSSSPLSAADVPSASKPAAPAQVAAIPQPIPPSNLPIQERSISFTIAKKPK